VASHPAVERAISLVSFPIQYNGRPTSINGVDLQALRLTVRTPWVVEPRDPAVFDAKTNANRVLVSESFSERYRVRSGDRL